MENKIFLFSTESRYGVGGNLASLIKYLKDSDHKISLVGAASGYQNGNEKLAKAQKIDFHIINDPEDSLEYENIFKKNIHARFLFWDWHLIAPPKLLSEYPIFLLSPGPLYKLREFAGPTVYTEAWRLAKENNLAFIALYHLQKDGKKLWYKKINFSEGKTRKALSERMHYHMRSSLPEILEKIFQ